MQPIIDEFFAAQPSRRTSEIPGAPIEQGLRRTMMAGTPQQRSSLQLESIRPRSTCRQGSLDVRD